jgi:hypothetical protein
VVVLQPALDLNQFRRLDSVGFLIPQAIVRMRELEFAFWFFS